MLKELPNVEAFDWDMGNIYKNLFKHHVSHKESEEVFKNKPLVLYFDAKHSSKEERHVCLGKTDAGRLLSISFTIRKNKIRVISARDMNKKEKKEYAKKEIKANS